MIAYHEIGHALVASLLPEANKLDKVTILPRGAAAGYTRFMPDEERLDSGLVTKASCQAELVVSLGGVQLNSLYSGHSKSLRVPAVTCRWSRSWRGRW